MAMIFWESGSKSRKTVIVVLGALLILGGLLFWTSREAGEQNQNGNRTELPPMPDSPYVSAADWPPELNISEEKFSCTEAGAETERAGGTARKTIRGRIYCVTQTTEGAAGSSYTMYAYAFEKDGKTAILTYSIRFSQCANYDEADQSACAEEQEKFDPDSIAHAYAQNAFGQ